MPVVVDEYAHSVVATPPAAGSFGVAQMEVGRIISADGCGDAALGVTGVALTWVMGLL